MSAPPNAGHPPSFHDLPPDEVAIIARVVERIRANKDRFVQEWSERCASMFGAQHDCSEALFRETYVPYLRSAVVRLGTGNGEGFAAFSALLGERLASTDAPFSVFVAHLNLLKESCLFVLSDEMGDVSRPVRLTIDKLAACCVSAVADSYYRSVNGPIPPAACSAPPPRSIPGLGRMFHGMVGRSPAMQRLFEQIGRLAATAAPVLIAGETGTGKELIARAIHHEGPRGAGPFVAVNCAALPAELIESELFGYQRGAFSGAMTDHVSLFRAASGGTLFLDEITEMSHELQAKLLRVVQERTVRPLGSVNEVPVDARIITSTNRDAQEIVASRALRADLYYRLCGTLLHVPPLRERGDDLLLLAEHRLAELNERYGDSVPAMRGFTADAMASILARPWPGNVRELFNALEYAFASCGASHITRDDLPLEFAAGAGPAGESAADETFAAGERTLIARALQATGGNKVRAARSLGISRKRLYAKLAKYALPMLLLSQIAHPPLHAAPRRLLRRSAACGCVTTSTRARVVLASTS